MVLTFRPRDSVRCAAVHGCLDLLPQRFSSSGSIKGKVKKNTSPAAGYFLTFQPVLMSEDGSDFPSQGLGSVCSRTWLFGSSSPAVFIVWFYKRKSQEKHLSCGRIFSYFPARVNERGWF